MSGDTTARPNLAGEDPTASTSSSGAATTWRRVRAQADAEVRTVFRNGEQVLLTLVLPALALIILGGTDLVDAGPDPMGRTAPGVLALAVMSTSFTSQAITTGFDRQTGVLKLMATTPLGRSGLVAGKVVAVGVVQFIQLFGLGALAMLLGWRPAPTAGLALVILLGTAAFVALALLMAGTMRAEIVLAGANLIWVLLAVGGGILLPSDRLPTPLAQIAPLLPSGALGDAMRATTSGDMFPAGPLLVLTLWAIGATAAVVRTFRWTS